GGRRGGGKGGQPLPLEGEDPAVLAWRTGDVDRDVLVREREDGLVHGREEPPGVEPALGEAGADERRTLVEGHQVAEDVAGAEDLLLDLLRLLDVRDGG